MSGWLAWATAVGSATFLLVTGAPTRAPVVGPPRLGAAAQSSAADRQADALLTDYMRATGIPGLQLAVVRDGRIVTQRAYGRASVEFDVAVTHETIFAINSVTKAFTGVAAMRLVEAGTLALDAPIGRYVDDLPAAWQPIPVRQLLTHMSGLPDVVRAPTVETDSAAAWDWVRQQPMAFAPGERFAYNQTNYALIQMAINRLRRRPLDEAPASEQIALLGLAHTRYGDSSEVVVGKAPSYRFSPATAGQPRVLRPVHERFLPERRSASGLNSTAGDLARWLLALTDGRLLEPRSLEVLWTPASFTNGTVGQWALGWMIADRHGTRVARMTGGGRAALAYVPAHRLGVVILTNLAGAYPEDVIDVIGSLYAPEMVLTGVPALRRALEADGFDDVERAARAIEATTPGHRWPESELNDWGYRLLAAGRHRESLAVFGFIAARFPASSNAHDSLGEALAANGDVAAAIRAYQRSLELDPRNTNAVQQLARLRERR